MLSFERWSNRKLEQKNSLLIKTIDKFISKYLSIHSHSPMNLFAWKSEPTTIFGVVLGSMTAITFLPLMIYYFFKFYRYRNNVMLKKRYSALTILQLIFCCLVVFGMSIFQLAMTNIFGSSTLFAGISAMLALISAVIVMNLLLFRNWQIIFDNNFAKATQNISWQILINENENQKTIEQFNWWMKHKHNLGNYYFVRQIVTAKILFESIVIAVPWTFVLSLIA